jgi:EAL domain-containing protein (putative c-di-GMP-specific phosphodiesterase class I)
MRDAEGTIDMLRAMKSLGVRISVDDFGTGYSSLAYLRRFPIDILKIDRSFVRDIGSDSDDEAIVRAIMALAKTMRLLTIAEGVETRPQLDFLLKQGCDRLQGYFFGRPVDTEEISARLQLEERERSRRIH